MSIGNAFKDKLMDALHTAVGHFNEGSDPNTAVVKAAQEFDFNADQATRLVETFNTARTIYHYKSASDRASEFDIADPAAVIPAMFKEEPEKTATAVNQDYSSYDVPEADYREGMVVKAAGVQDVDLGTPQDYLDTNLETQSARAMKAVNSHRQLAEAATGEAGIAGTKAAQVLGKLAAELGRGYESDCLDRYSRLQLGYNVGASDTKRAQWGPVLTKLSEFVPQWLESGYRGIKQAGVIDDTDLQAYVDLLKEAKYWMEAEAEMLAVADQLNKEADAFEREWLDIFEPTMPKARESSVADFLTPSLAKLAGQDYNPGDSQDKSDKPKEKKTEPGFMGKLVQDSASSAAKENLGGVMSHGVDAVIGAPKPSENRDLSERLKNVQRQIMLEDLMVNDPVLSDEDPETVTQAYQSVLSIAPHLASNKEIVRAILRQAVHSVAISPYEGQVWTDLEKNIRNLTSNTTGATDTQGRPLKV